MGRQEVLDIDSLKPGPEMDRLVAEAIGDRLLVAHKDDMAAIENAPDKTLIAVKHPESIEIVAPKPYSTDLNAAFEAAEKMGLFPAYVLVKKQTEEPWWGLFPAFPLRNDPAPFPTLMHSQFGCLAFAPTPAMAISKATLKLKEKNNAQSS